MAGAREKVTPAEHPYGSHWEGEEAWAISLCCPDRIPLVAVAVVLVLVRDRDIAWEGIAGDTAWEVLDPYPCPGPERGSGSAQQKPDGVAAIQVRDA